MINDRIEPARPPLTLGLLRLLAIASGLIIANIYYNQSLLVIMGREFRVSSAAMAAMAVATQLGFASGLLLLVPLGDVLDRRMLIISSAASATAAMVALALSPHFTFALIGSYVLGVACITPQLIVPYAAHLAEPAQRGRVVGWVMGGLLVGILFARSAAGFLGQCLGWRAVFGLGAGLTLVMTLALPSLPASPPSAGAVSYSGLLKSLPPLLAREPILLRHALIGSCGFGAFSAFWTTIAFYLASRPEHFGGNMVGIFGLIGAAGAFAAPISGHFSDRHGAKTVNGVALGIIAFSFLLMVFAYRSLIWLVLGAFLMDAGVQASHISNQTRIYALSPAQRNRITSVYMVILFIGGAIGSALGSRAWLAGRWTGLCVLGASMPLLGLLVLFAWPAGTQP
jgi:predicted MFS family arabinose efflux permease